MNCLYVFVIFMVWRRIVNRHGDLDDHVGNKKSGTEMVPLL